MGNIVNKILPAKMNQMKTLDVEEANELSFSADCKILKKYLVSCKQNALKLSDKENMQMNNARKRDFIQDDSELILLAKLKKLSLDEKVLEEKYKNIKSKLNVRNCLAAYEFSQLFNLPDLNEAAFHLLQRCFTMLFDDRNCLELSCESLSKILSSSQLAVTSELEVFNAARGWLNFYAERRHVFAKRLLPKVRLSLLSADALKHVLNEATLLYGAHECVAIMKESASKLSEVDRHRFCDQDSFKILVLGGINKIGKFARDVKQIDAGDYKILNELSPLINGRVCCEAVCLKGEVFVFVGTGSNSREMKSVDKYSPATDSWVTVADSTPDLCWGFSACALMDKVFVFGGLCERNDALTNRCWQFDAGTTLWKEVAAMGDARMWSASAAYRGAVVTCGGLADIRNVHNTVESYDVIGDRWARMPSMVRARHGPGLVAVKGKLFVVDWTEKDAGEVFDGNEFSLLKNPRPFRCHKALSVGSKIVIFQYHYSSSVVVYDVEKDEWSEETCDVAGVNNFSCVKLPFYHFK